MVNFPTWIPDCDSHSPAVLDLFISFYTSICSAMGNSDHVVVSVSNSKRDALFHSMAYDYSFADWDVLRDHLRDVPWEDIFKLSDSAVAAREFCELEVMYISLIESIMSNLTHLHGFLLLVLHCNSS